MVNPKRKQLWNNSYETEFPGIKRSKSGEEFAHCVPCNCDINIVSIRKNAITTHLQTPKHQKAAASINTSQTIKAFATTSTCTPLDKQALAAEGYLKYQI